MGLLEWDGRRCCGLVGFLSGTLGRFEDRVPLARAREGRTADGQVFRRG
jgi:hypothetical protein